MTIRQALRYNALDRERSRVNALASVFTKTNRILTGDRSITVSITEPAKNIPPNTPAYSNGQDITINVNMIKDLTTKGSLMTLQGCNYHELCHWMFSPRSNTDLRRWVNTSRYQIAFNILEDQRIETLFTAIYKPARHYFVSMILEHIMSDKESWGTAHVLLHGRRYLPKAIRDEFAARWVDTATTSEVSRIIDEYRLLDLSPNWHSGSHQRAQVLISLLARVLSQLPSNQKCGLGKSAGCQVGEQTNGCADRNQSYSAVEEAKKETKEQDEKEEEGQDGSNFWEDDDDEQEEGKDEKSGSSGEDSQMDSEDGDGGPDESDVDENDSDSDAEVPESGTGDEDGDDSEEGTEGDSSDASGDDGETSGSGDAGSDGESSDENGEDGKDPGQGVGGGGMTKQELSNELEDVLNAIGENAQIIEDVRQLNNAMSDPNNFDLDAPNSNTIPMKVPSHIRRACDNVSAEFRRLYAEMEPGWKYESDSGRLNVSRAIYSDDPDTIFDEWDEGRQESAGLELVIALDVSGSMGRYSDKGYSSVVDSRGTPITAACFAVWIMKRACEELGATVSVVGFGQNTTTVLSRQEKATNTHATYVNSLEGNTRPGEAFAIARWVLSQSQMPNKLFVVVTDGEWVGTFSGNNGGKKVSRYLGADTEGNQFTNTSQLHDLLQEIDATKVYLGIGRAASPAYRDCFDVSRVIDNAQEIVPVVKSAIEKMIRSVR